MATRVLLVDDHEPSRQHLRSIVSASGCQIIGEADNGTAGRDQTLALEPDVTIIDVEMPGLNGIEALRQIRTAGARTRILVVSSHQSSDVAGAAFGAGAHGYIVKLDAAREIPAAIAALVRGRRFVSRRFTGTPRPPAPRPSHTATFDDRAESLTEELARFSETALRRGQTVIVLIHASRRAAFEQRLRSSLNLDAALRQGRYLRADATEAMRNLTVDGRADEERFWAEGLPLMLRAAAVATCEYPRIAACGDGTDQLVQWGLLDAAVRLEQLWDELARLFGADVLCAFSSAAHADPAGHPMCPVHASFQA